MTGQEIEEYVRGKIREARSLAGINKRTMALQMGVSPSTWLAWEHGKREIKIGLVAEIARATGRDWSFFFPPEMEKPDLGAVLHRLYPDMEPATARAIKRLADVMNDDDIRMKHSGGRRGG